MTFTLALWVIAVFIFLSDRHNRTNRWFAYCYLLASLGTLKEFFMDDIVPLLLKAYPEVALERYVTINSCVTAFIYLLSPFCFITLSMYFSDLNKKNKKLFVLVHIVTFVIILACLRFYTPTHFKYYQLNRKDFWYVMSSFNVGYAMIGSVVMFRNIKKETVFEIKRRKRITLEILLLPYYFCLFAIFIIHTLGVDNLKKIWKSNVYLVAAVLIFYIYIAYKEGFMGVKISFVKYDWNSEMQSINTSTQYINHMLKNHATKIIWSVENIREKMKNSPMEELDIIERSTRQLMAFTERTNKSLSPKLAGDDICGSSNLIYEALESANPQQGGNATLAVDVRDDVLIVCDAQSILEVIRNLIVNGIEAITQDGQIKITSYFNRKDFCIEVADNGIGITAEQMKQIFKPFYTTKKNNINFGVGLPYCKNVMQAHDGSIEVFSNKDTGTRFIMRFPLKRIKRKEQVSVEQQNKSVSG